MKVNQVMTIILKVALWRLLVAIIHMSLLVILITATYVKSDIIVRLIII